MGFRFFDIITYTDTYPVQPPNGGVVLLSFYFIYIFLPFIPLEYNVFDDPNKKWKKKNKNELIFIKKKLKIKQNNANDEVELCVVVYRKAKYSGKHCSTFTWNIFFFFFLEKTRARTHHEH